MVEPPTISGMEDSGLVQPILVGPSGGHTDVITTAMQASTSALLNRLPGTDAAWDEWLSGAFTKSVRHVNATRFDRAVEMLGDIGGHLFESRYGACAVAFTPMRYQDFPKLISRARVAGLDRPRRPDPPASPGPWVVLNSDVVMTTGKAAAQASHALMAQVLRDGADSLGTAGIAGVKVRTVSGGEFARLADAAPHAVIRDAGFTEVAPGSATATFVHIA